MTRFGIDNVNKEKYSKLMKKTLLLLLVCLFGALGGVKAYTVDDLTTAGWTKVSDISNDASNENYVGNFVYVLVDAGSSNYLMSGETTTVAGYVGNKPTYRTLANPCVTPYFVWTLEVRNGGFAMRNIVSAQYFNSNSSTDGTTKGLGWEDTMSDDYPAGTFTFTINSGKYDIQGVSSEALVGPWNNDGAVASNGEAIAANKSTLQAPGFEIYRMAKATYLRNYLKQVPNLTSPVDASYLITNPTIYQGGADTEVPWGWNSFEGHDTDDNKFTDGTGNTKLRAHKKAKNDYRFDFDYYCAINNLPGGNYKVITNGYGSPDRVKSYLYIDNNNVPNSKESQELNAGSPAKDYETAYLPVATGNNITLGIEADGRHDGGSQGHTSEAFADDFRLKVDPYLSTMATTLPDGGAMTAGLWYSFSVDATGYYNLTRTTALNNIDYAAGTSTPLSEGNKKFYNNTLLTAGETYYMRSSTDNTFAYEASMINAVAAAYPTSGELTANTWYVYSIPMTGDYYFSATDGVVYTTDGNQSVFISGTAATTKISLAKGDNLYVKSSTAQTVKVEGIFYLSTTVGGKTKWLSRMVDHNYASVDDFGLAFKFTTDGSGISYFQFLENDGYYLDDDNNYYVATKTKRGDNTNKWVLETVDGGYKILLQVNQACKLFVANTSTGLVKITNNSDTEYIWNFVTPTEHDAQMQAWVDAQANAAATAGGRSESTKAALEAVLANTLLYEAQDKTSQITGNPTDVADNFETGGQLFTEQTISELPTGFYRLRYYGYQRISSNEVTYSASQKDSDGGVAYVYANGQKTRLMSVMDVASDTQWDGSNDYEAGGKYYPNSKTGAKNAFDAGNYANDVYVYVNDGNLTFGVYNPSNPGCANWAPGYKFELTYYATATVTARMQVSATAKMGTFCAPFDVEIPSGVKAYTLSEGSNASWVHMDEVVGAKIDAGTPVLLTSDEKVDKDVQGQTSVLEPDNSGLLKGVFVKTPVAKDDNNYLLQYQDGQCAFYLVSDNGINIGKNRCYLHMDAKNSARIAIGDEDDPTGISEIEFIESEAKTMKDGKYLVKGRIVLVKNGKAFSANGQKLN